MKATAAVFPVLLSVLKNKQFTTSEDDFDYKNITLFLYDGVVFCADAFNGSNKVVKKSIPQTILFDGVHYSNSAFSDIFLSTKMDFFNISF